MSFEEWWKSDDKAYYLDWEDEDTAVVKSACLAAYQAGQADQREKDARIAEGRIFMSDYQECHEGTCNYIAKAIREQ